MYHVRIVKQLLTVIIAPKEINCKIFRCGIFKKTLKPIPAHSSKANCLNFVKQNKIYGCGHPFFLECTSDFEFITKTMNW